MSDPAISKEPGEWWNVLPAARMLDCAQFLIINWHHRREDLAAEHLGCLLWHAQALNFIWLGIPLFNEDFLAWNEDAPVLPDLFSSIPRFMMCPDALPGASTDRLSRQQRDSLLATARALKEFDLHDLLSCIKKSDPWQEAADAVRSGEPGPIVIQKSSIRSYYRERFAEWI